MRFSPFDFDVITTPDEPPRHKPAEPVPNPDGGSDHAIAPEHRMPDEKPK